MLHQLVRRKLSNFGVLSFEHQTYGEIAERLSVCKPELSQWLHQVEKRWHELAE